MSSPVRIGASRSPASRERTTERVSRGGRAGRRFRRGRWPPRRGPGAPDPGEVGQLLRAPGEPYRREDQGDGADDDVLDVGEAARPESSVRRSAARGRSARTFCRALPRTRRPTTRATTTAIAQQQATTVTTPAPRASSSGDQVVALAVGGGRRQLTHEDEYGVDDRTGPSRRPSPVRWRGGCPRRRPGRVPRPAPGADSPRPSARRPPPERPAGPPSPSSPRRSP